MQFIRICFLTLAPVLPGLAFVPQQLLAPVLYEALPVWSLDLLR